MPQRPWLCATRREDRSLHADMRNTGTSLKEQHEKIAAKIDAIEKKKIHISAPEAETKLKEYVVHRFKSVHESFLTYDRDHSGFLEKSEATIPPCICCGICLVLIICQLSNHNIPQVRHILDDMNYIIDEGELEKLIAMYEKCLRAEARTLAFHVKVVCACFT